MLVLDLAWIMELKLLDSSIGEHMMDSPILQYFPNSHQCGDTDHASMTLFLLLFHAFLVLSFLHLIVDCNKTPRHSILLIQLHHLQHRQ